MITIDKLRNLNYSNVICYGTGVVKLHLGGSKIYRFYSDISTLDEIHDHRCNFTSTVLKGILRNRIYELSICNADSTLQVIRSECKPNAERIVEEDNATIIEVCNFTTCVGESYYLKYDLLHKVERVTPKVITFMEKELPNIQSSSRIIMDESVEDHISPLSTTKSEAECWEIIDFTLKD